MRTLLLVVAICLTIVSCVSNDYTLSHVSYSEREMQVLHLSGNAKKIGMLDSMPVYKAYVREVEDTAIFYPVKGVGSVNYFPLRQR